MGLFSFKRADFRVAVKAGVGKLPAGADLYVHWTAVPMLPPSLEEAAHVALTTAWFPPHDLIKFDASERYVSLLAYDDFEGLAHPANAVTHRVYQDGYVEVDDYTVRDNPTILHRKELFVPAGYPLRAVFEALTQAEVAAGLLTRPPGYRRQWEELVAGKGYRIVGHRVVRL